MVGAFRYEAAVVVVSTIRLYYKTIAPLALPSFTKTFFPLIPRPGWGYHSSHCQYYHRHPV